MGGIGKLLAGLIVVALSQCETTHSVGESKPASPERADIKGLFIVNQTTTDITEVQLLIEGATQQVNINRVLAGSQFETAFQAEEYQGRPARLVWRQNGSMHQSQPIIFDLPRELYQDRAVTAYLVVEPDFKVRALTR
ncbi:hypothetical protein [Rubritalea tangerina]|uniref:DUF1425 domain-containing protein n=1 Tax=Rubritalea tangerina TaxID=430798 RepID=A0ABW4ZA85_9BACT